MIQTITNEGHLKRLRYRAWHRGTRELDLLLGPFADAHVETLSAPDLYAFEQLLEIPDPKLHDLIMCGGDLPDAQQNLLLKKLRAFHRLAA